MELHPALLSGFLRLSVRDVVHRFAGARGKGRRRATPTPGVAISPSSRAGGSKYPIDLLKDAGVDMTTDEPLALTMKTMNRVMDEMEALLASPAAIR